jgi:hypothetical protein
MTVYRCTCGPYEVDCAECQRCTWCADHSGCPTDDEGEE